MRHIFRKFINLASALICGASLAQGAPFVFNNGDLILGFQATGGTGASRNVFFNLGSGTSHRDNGDLGQLGNIAATLSNVYGSDWYTREDLYFGVVGNLNGGSPTGFPNTAAVAGDPSRTFYVSRASAFPSQADLIAAASYPSASLGSAATKLSGMEDMLVGGGAVDGLTAEADGSAILDQTTQTVQWNNGWSAWNPTPGASFDTFSGGIQQNFGKGGTATYVDVQRILATATGANPAGVVGGGTFETSIAVTSAGVVKALSSAPVPQKVLSLNGALDFGNVTVGSTDTRVLTISNLGNAALTINGITYPSGFTGSWSGNIAAGESQNVTVTFSPTESLTYSGDVDVDSNKTSGAGTIAISGTGTPPPARVIALSGDLAFGNVEIGSSATSSLVISNTGNTELAVSGITCPAGFSGNWSGSIAAGESQNVTVTFSPDLEQSFSGNISVASDKTSGSPSIAVSGTGVPVATRIIALTGDLAFGNASVGSSGKRVLTISNPGNSALNVSGITCPAGFSGNWTGSVLAGGSKNVTLTFSPATVKSYSGTVTVASNKTSGIRTIAVSGTGVPAPTRIIGLAGNLAFGEQAVSGKTKRVLTISNTGNAPLTITGIVYPEGFGGDWTGTIPVGEFQEVTVTFSPAAAESYSGKVKVASDKTSGTATLAISGMGAFMPEIQVEQPVGTNLKDGALRKSIGTVKLGKTGSAKTFTITNKGSAKLKGLAVGKTGGDAKDFVITAPEKTALAPGESTTFKVRFRPTAAGIRNAALHITSNDADENPFDIKLSGTGATP